MAEAYLVIGVPANSVMAWEERQFETPRQVQNKDIFWADGSPVTTTVDCMVIEFRGQIFSDGGPDGDYIGSFRKHLMGFGLELFTVLYECPSDEDVIGLQVATNGEHFDSAHTETMKQDAIKALKAAGIDIEPRFHLIARGD